MSSDARKKYYAGISILISNAFWNLSDKDFQILAKSIREYLYEHEKGDIYGESTKRAKGEEASSRD